MQIVTPDTVLWPKYIGNSVFLAGTIDNGHSFNWQQLVIDSLKDIDCVVFNPRKESWDYTLDPREVSKALRVQVEWEQKAIEASTIVFFHFVGGSVSPISLLEYGQCYEAEKSTIVSCSADFFRFGNIKIMQDKIQEPTYTDFNKAVQFLKQCLSN
jgi:hypothetical protein